VVFYIRCCYHLALGLVLAWAWLIFADSSGLCFGPGNTEEYWFGLYLLLLQFMARSATFMQRSLKRSQGLNHWFRFATPYLLEVVLYSGAAMILMGHGGGDTLSTPFAGTAALHLAILSLLCLALLPICSLILGWKLSESRLPAWLPVMSAGCLSIVATPFFYKLNYRLAPDTFPLLQVSAVSLCALLFLFGCSRFRGRWLCSERAPHPALALASLAPCFIVFILTLDFFSRERLPAILFLFLLGVAVVAFAACPVYFLVWLFPRPLKGLALYLLCGVLGVLAFYNVVWIVSIVFSVERAPWMPPWGSHFLLGGFSLLAPLCIRIRERSRPLEPPQKTTRKGIVEPPPKSFPCEL
jgi:hypothetical protein